MYKLTYEIWWALGSVVVLMAATYFGLKQFPDALIGLPGVAVIGAFLVAPLLVALIFFGKGSAGQKAVVVAIGILFSVIFGVAGNIISGTTQVLPNFQLLINQYLLGVVALGGAITAALLCRLKPASEVSTAPKKPAQEVVISDKEETAKSSSTKLPAQSEPLKPVGSNSATNLKGILDTLAPEDSSSDLPVTPVKTGLAASLSGTKSSAPAPAKQPEPVTPAAPTTPAVTPVPLSPTTTTSTPAVQSPSAEVTTPQATPGPSDSQTNIKKATTGTVASSTATRLQAQKRKSTSTFTKLQALSASGTGGVRPRPAESSGSDNDADSLKSILDRLDTKQDEEVEMDSLFGQESLLSPPEVTESEPELESKPAPAPSPTPKPAEPVKTTETPKPTPAAPPKPVETAKPVEAPKPTEAPKPAAQQAPKPSVAAKPATSSSPLAKKPEAGPSLSSMLDSLDAPKSTTSSTSPAAKTSPPGTTSGATNKPVSATPTPVKPAPTTVPPAKPATPAQAPKPAGTPAAKTPTPISTPKPAETPKPAAKTEPVTAKPEPVKAEVKPLPKPEVAKAPIKSEPIKEESGLFETGLDKEIDDIFSSLVPAEAQKNVEAKLDQEEPVSKPAAEEPEAITSETSSVAKAPEKEKEGVFETKIDQELDDIFSNLVPAEAQKEVASKFEKSTELHSSNKEQESAIENTVVEEPVVEPVVEEPVLEPVVDEPAYEEPASEQPAALVDEVKDEPGTKIEGMFEETGLDRELDDIFSNLAPSEAQQSVTRETLARVRAADVTGDHPAITPDNVMRERSKAQEEMSFAPPTEAETEAETERAEELKAAQKVDEEVSSVHDEEAAELKPGKFNETLQAMPSLQATVEGLLNSLASASDTIVKTETESFAPPEPSNGSSATKAQDLIESLEAGAQAAQESAEAAAESSSGDIVSDLFDTPSQETSSPEGHDDLVTEAVSESEVVEETSESSQTEALESASEGPPEQVTDLAEEEEAQSADAVEVAEASHAGVEEAAGEPAQTEANKKTAKELKEFGRLSIKKGGDDFQTETAGTMKTIGKLLLEVQAVENIIKAGESGTIGSGLTTARVISAARGEGIKALLSKIDSYSGVDGSVIVGHDGLVIASTAPAGMDKDTLGVLSVACLSTSNLATKKLEIGKLRQMVLITDAKTTVLTDVDVGILAVFLNNNDVGKIDGLLEAIHDTIHG